MKIESMRNQAKKEIYFCVSIFRFKKKKKKKLNLHKYMIMHALTTNWLKGKKE